jgi:hypothetical protein
MRYPNTTTTDGGSADIAGAIICPSIHGDSLELFQTILSIRPIWMWEVRKMQEQFSATPSMEIKNEKWVVQDYRW